MTDIVSKVHYSMGSAMRSLNDNGANVAITVKAATELLALREHYNKHLKFHLFLDDKSLLALRIHDRIYSDDWIIEINGVGVSFSTTLITRFQSLVLDCAANEANQSGFEFRVLVQDQIVSTLDGDDVLARIESQEIEVCDAYGEFCYTTYS